MLYDLHTMDVCFTTDLSDEYICKENVALSVFRLYFVNIVLKTPVGRCHCFMSSSSPR